MLWTQAADQRGLVRRSHGAALVAGKSLIWLFAADYTALGLIQLNDLTIVV